MADLALSTPEMLREYWEQFAPKPSVQILKAPQTGLLMLRARVGNTGALFNFGEMSLTSCAVTVNDTLGQAWIAGVCPEHAQLAAIFDSLMQQESHAARLSRELLEPLRRHRNAELTRRTTESAPTKVDFFTLVRGED